MPAPAPFVPPPYPHDRLTGLRERAARAGGVVDASVGNPVDPMPAVVVDALREAAPAGTGYPPSIGTPALRAAAAGWLGRRLGVQVAPEHVIACVGTKELVASLPHHLHLRDPSRDTVLYPAISYPTYAMGAALAGLRAVPVPLDDRWLPDLGAVADTDARRALVLWCNEPGNPTGSFADDAALAGIVEWARAHGVIVASDECYVELTWDADGAPRAGASALAAGADGVLAVHSCSKRSNMAGLRAGFVAGDAGLVGYLGEIRKHAGLMVPAPVQAAAAAALDDDAHVDRQRDRYAARRQRLLPAIEAAGFVSDGGPATFYLWLRAADGVDGWRAAERLADAGVLVAPGDFYGPGGAGHVRLALTLTDDDVERAVRGLERLGG